MTDNQLLLWATSQIARECADKTFGTVSFSLQAGKIMGSEVKRSAKPPVDISARKD